MRTDAAKLALTYLAHPLASFHPARMPAMVRRNYRFELVATSFFSLVAALVEGGLIGVIVKNAFEGVAEQRLLHYAVAVLAAAPEFANLTSFLWARLSHGRPKVRFINTLQLAVAVIVGLIALVPRSQAGLLMLGGAVIAARVCLTGIITLRATVWLANYPRSDRARVTGKLSTLQSLIVAAVGLGVSTAMDLRPDSFRVYFPCAAAGALVGVAAYARVRVRGSRRMLRVERESGDDDAGPSFNPMAMWRTLAADRRYAWFMLNMFILGTGNLMLTAPLVITLKDQFGQGYLGGVLVIQSIPMLVMPLAIPLWARLLDRVHVVRFRSVHSWAFVAAQSLVLLGATTGALWMMYVGAAALGVGYGGGALAWNLGHLDFAPAHKASQYMGVHVTLNGVRGLAAPLLAVFVYDRLSAAAAGQWVFGVSVVLCVVGAVGFGVLARGMGGEGSEGGEKR